MILTSNIMVCVNIKHKNDLYVIQSLYLITCIGVYTQIMQYFEECYSPVY